MPVRKVDERMRQRLPALWANAELTLLDIAKRFGVSDGTIAALAKQMQLPERPRRVRLTRRNRVRKADQEEKK